MDPLSALAIAAAVVQFADIGGQLMVKAWRKYREKEKQNQTNSEGQWVQETELEDVLKELTLFTRTVRESTDRVVSPQAISKPAESQLVRLCEECESIAEYFQNVLTAAKKRPVQKPSQRGSKDESDLSGLWAPGTVGNMQRRLNVLQQSVTSTVILCLWEDSKQTKKWEDDFGNKLSKVFSLLERIEQSTSGSTLPWVDARNLDWLLNEASRNDGKYGTGQPQDALEPSYGQHIRSDSRPNLFEGPEHGSYGDRPTNDLVHMFSHFVASDKKKVSDGFKKTLNSESKTAGQICEELTSRLWRKDWQPDHSDSNVEARNPLTITDLTTDIVELMTNDLRFDTFDRRQEAIPHTFQSTYRWIFDRQPKSKLSELYNVIWERIPEKNRSDGSWMIQVLAAAQGPLECLTMWLADESRSRRADIAQVSVDIRERAAVLIKRKLASRTRGILEVVDASGRNFVDFSHRTARDWVRQAEVWDRIRASYYGDKFNSHLVLFEAETMTFLIPHGLQGSRWAGMKRSLWYASQSCGEGEQDTERLVQSMDFFDDSVQERYERGTWPSQGVMTTTRQRWSMSQNFSLLHHGFLSLAAQYAILPYVQAKTGNGRSLPGRKTAADYTSLLDCAVFGYEFFTGYDVTDPLQLPPIPVKRRLAMVKFLVDAGSVPGPRFREYLAQEKARHETDGNHMMLQYYEEISACIKAKQSVRRHARGVLEWATSVLRSPRLGSH
ncbi:hypothetical protein PG987_010421 [Apiospora arundinis]